jgi:hypothetical protein
MLAAFALIGLMSAPAPAHETCGFVIKIADRFENVGLGTVDLADTAKPLTAPAGQGPVVGMLCKRKSLLLGPHDDRPITELSVPFYVGDKTRTAVLVVVKGQFAYQVLQGQLSRVEIDQTQQRLNEFQARENELTVHDRARSGNPPPP